MKKFVLIVSVLFLIAGITAGQETRREKRKAREKARMEEVKLLFDSHNFQFLAQTATPMGGGVIQLTSNYTLDFRDGQVVSYLPYFGVAYSAEYGTSEGGIKFDEKALSAEWKTSKKGYDILMEIKTRKDMYHLRLFFFANGYASLGVTCNNRQPISFSGIVQAIPEKEK